MNRWLFLAVATLLLCVNAWLVYALMTHEANQTISRNLKLSRQLR